MKKSPSIQKKPGGKVRGDEAAGKKVGRHKKGKKKGEKGVMPVGLAAGAPSY